MIEDDLRIEAFAGDEPVHGSVILVAGPEPGGGFQQIRGEPDRHQEEDQLRHDDDVYLPTSEPKQRRRHRQKDETRIEDHREAAGQAVVVQLQGRRAQANDQQDRAQHREAH